jgi:hypothetical protein
LSFLGERGATRVRVLSLGIAFRRHDSGNCLTIVTEAATTDRGSVLGAAVLELRFEETLQN